MVSLLKICQKYRRYATVLVELLLAGTTSKQTNCRAVADAIDVAKLHELTFLNSTNNALLV